ncbi:MAG: hypothetical protein LQ343_004244 [Gyalolechia ehrenbergii]|nr:MAG: hypothetical protein LQ343_004244 [Gyalolechia ehrenbergii]
MLSLGHYFSLLYDSGIRDGKPLVKPKKHFRQDPQLDRKRVNVILVYAGAFNPAHRGHLAVLYHAYEQLAEELNIVAAIIRPANDLILQQKHQKYSPNEKRCIRFDDRACLWKEDPHLPPWACESFEVSSSAFRKKLKAVARKDGCKIRFADLVGPEAVFWKNRKDQFGEMTIVSDVAREAIHDGQHGFRNICLSSVMKNWYVDVESLGTYFLDKTHDAMQRRLEEPRAQEAIATSEDGARRAGTGNQYSVPNLPPNLSHGASELAIARVDGLLACEEDEQRSRAPEVTESLATQLSRRSSPSSVTVCWWKGASPRKSLRLLRSTAEQHGPFRGISSSEIQKKMHELKGYKLKSALESVALSPSLLWDVLLPRRLQRDGLNDRHDDKCTSLSNIKRDVVTVPTRQLHSLLLARGISTLDDITLATKKSDVFLFAELVQPGKQKSDSQDDAMTNGTVIQIKVRKMREGCFDCLYDKIVDVSLRDWKRKAKAKEGKDSGKRHVI